MDTQQFLREVWPASGPYLIAIPHQWVNREGKAVKGFRHFPHDSADTAVQQAMALATHSEAPKDVYFAMASIKGKLKKGIRKTPNISKVKSFWLDLDVRTDKPGHYTSFDVAAHALRTFCSRFQFPKPIVSHSGGGFHVFWTLTGEIDAGQWDHYAALLKAVTKAHGLLADPTRTADSTSVLRIPGTYNWKTGQPRLVNLVTTSGPVDTRVMLARIAAAAEEMGVDKAPLQSNSLAIPGQNPAAGKPTAASNQNALDGTVEDVPSNPKRVVGKCQQLRAQAEDPANVDEPQWYAMIGCLRHAERGAQAVHLMSKGYPGYSAQETDDKIAQHKAGGYGPTTCIAFENANPDGCKGCPFYGKITTPLQLGRERQALGAPTINLVTTSGQKLQFQLPPAPAPFKRVVDGNGNTVIAVTVTNADDTDEDVVIYDNDLYPAGLFFDERANKYYVTVRRYLPKDGWSEFDVATGSFFDRRNLAIMLGDMGVIPMIDKIEHVVNYMLAYIKELQAAAKSAVVYAKMGWREDDQFVLPDRVISKTGVEDVSPSKNTINALRWVEPKGDINEWISVGRLYEQPGLEAMQFGFGVGFAAPLFRFTNYNGMIVSLVGAAGCGKSSAALLANSIWGHKKVGWVDSQHDTLRAFYNKLGVLHNLPVTYDEITNLQAEDLSDLCYSVSKGEGRQRLNQDGSAKEDFGSWQTMMLATSNASLHSRLTLAKADSSAEAVRVFEYYVPSNTLSKPVADAAFDKLNDNFGIAGPIYMDYVLKNVNSIRARVHHWMKVIDQKAKVSSGERFWSAAPACVLAGFEASNACGLTNADIGRLLTFSIDCIEKMRQAVSTSVRSGFGVLSDYLNSNINKTLTIGTQPQPGAVALVKQEPRAGELRIRYEEWWGRLYVDRADLRRFCAKQAVDPNKLREELVAHGVLIEEKKHVLGKNTTFGHGQTFCWVLDMNNPMMGGSQQVMQQTAQGVASQAIANAQGQKA